MRPVESEACFIQYARGPYACVVDLGNLKEAGSCLNLPLRNAKKSLRQVLVDVISRAKSVVGADDVIAFD